MCGRGIGRLFLSLTLLLHGASGIAAATAGPALEVPGTATLDFRRVVREATEKVFPAVVFIRVLKVSHERGRKIAQEVSGSGVIISEEGEILTNWHVVDKAIEVRCLLFDGSHAVADVLGTDKDMDLALIRLRLPPGAARGEWSVARFGDSDALREGDFVMAMGAPWGLSRSVSMGIISCTRRYLPNASEYSLWLQTDAAISPGNSGGPLVDTEGRIVGINTLGVLVGGDMGFAIPAATIQIFLPSLREHGLVDWSYSGMQFQPLNDFNRNIYFPAETGVIVAGTDPDSPARRAGFQSRDRILRVAGQGVTARNEENLPAVRRLFGKLPRDEEVPIDFERDGRMLQAMLTPRQKGRVEGEALDCPRWDMTVKAINQFDTPDLFFHRPEGVFVYGLKSPGNARLAGLQEKDILLRVDNVPIETIEDLRAVHERLVADVANRSRVVLVVLRNGLTRQILLDFAREFDKE